MTQVLINLLTNAIHAIQGSGCGDRIMIGCAAKGGALHLTVADNGPGISDEIKTRIFDPLFTTKDIGKGTGVGLAYCQRIVTAHEGRIGMQSQGAGQGGPRSRSSCL